MSIRGDSIYLFISVWTTDEAQKSMLAYTSAALTRVRLPPGDPTTTLVHIMVQIRDNLNSAIEYRLAPVSVVLDPHELKTLIDVLHQPSQIVKNRNLNIRMLAGKNLNTVGQILTSISQTFSHIDSQSIDYAAASECTYEKILLYLSTNLDFFRREYSSH